MKTSTFTVRALLFASLQDAAGARQVEVEMAAGATVADLSARLGERYPALASRLPRVRVAVNEELVDAGRELSAGDEVAYLPPVSGGASEDVAVVDGEISVDALLRAVRRSDCGAVVLFLGTVRGTFQGEPVEGLEYEAHRALAEHALAAIAAEARRRFEIRAIAATHRIGRLAVGEISVAVAVAAPHRPAAFEAGRYAIDRLKEEVPIWKRELLTSGEVWIEGGERIPRLNEVKR